MNYILLTAVILLVVLGFLAVAGLVKSIVRLAAAFIVGLAIPAALHYVVALIGLAQVVPNLVYVLIGALSALSVLIRRRRR